ncbi:MAG: hypothetical protein U0836_23910 [Pirellulales bacterium]
MAIGVRQRAPGAAIIEDGPWTPAPFDLRSLLLLGIFVSGAAALGQWAGGGLGRLEFVGGLLALVAAAAIWWLWTRRTLPQPFPTTPEESAARQEELREEVERWRRGAR